MLAAKVLATVATNAGELQLVGRGERDFHIRLNGRILMASAERASEEAVATLACKEIADRSNPHVLIGGLGMAFTLRAALDALPAQARVTVAELTAEIDTWCRGPLAPLTKGAALDPRVRVVIADVARVIADAPRNHFDAIVVDLYEGPHDVTKHAGDPHYGKQALARTHAALKPGGVLAVWSEKLDPDFTKRMSVAGFQTSVHRPSVVRAYVVYLGRR